jgi:hypothetical protein
MKPLEVFFLVGTLLSLYWGYKSYRAAGSELLRIRKQKNLLKLRKELALLERLHSSPSERIAYMIEAILICLGAIGVVLMLSSLKSIANIAGFTAFVASTHWLGGGFIYLFAVYRLGRCHATTSARYDKIVERLSKAISEAV